LLPTMVGMLTTHARRSRDPAPQRLRGVSHLKKRGLYAEESVLSKFSRYETAIMWQIYRARHKLERRQAARRGAALTPPQALDVEVSGMPEETGY
jgi:hypothetical protein